MRMLDQFFAESEKLKQMILRENIHIVGLASIFIATKYEDIIPIRIKQLVRDASHSKY